jgi:hypothetical protein
MKFQIYLPPQEAEALCASAEAEKRDVRAQIVWLAMKALREQQSQNEEGRNEQRASA